MNEWIVCVNTTIPRIQGDAAEPWRMNGEVIYDYMWTNTTRGYAMLTDHDDTTPTKTYTAKQLKDEPHQRDGNRGDQKRRHRRTTTSDVSQHIRASHGPIRTLQDTWMLPSRQIWKWILRDTSPVRILRRMDPK